MSNENFNALVEESDLEIDVYSFTNSSLNLIEEDLIKKIEDNMNDVEFLEEEKATIQNPDKLGKVVYDQIITEAGNQLGMDLTDETLIQKYNREHPESYKDIAASIMAEKDAFNLKSIKKTIRKEGTGKIAGKAGLDALKAFLASGIIELIKSIVCGFVSFIKEKSKSFKIFLLKMQDSIKDFLNRIKSIFVTQGLGTAIGSVVSEIFGPIVSLFKKVASMIKEGVKSFVGAFRFLCDEKNRTLPLYRKIAEVGKIVTGTAGGMLALVLSEVFENALFGIPFLGTSTIANVLGIILASIVSGVIGAIVMNLIDSYVAKREKDDITKKEIEVNNEIIATQNKLINVKKEKMENTKENIYDNLRERQERACSYMEEALKDFSIDDSEDEVYDNEFDDMLKMLQ